jgi:hypothetical protein
MRAKNASTTFLQNELPFATRRIYVIVHIPEHQNDFNWTLFRESRLARPPKGNQ